MGQHAVFLSEVRIPTRHDVPAGTQVSFALPDDHLVAPFYQLHPLGIWHVIDVRDCRLHLVRTRDPLPPPHDISDVAMREHPVLRYVTARCCKAH